MDEQITISYPTSLAWSLKMKLLAYYNVSYISSSERDLEVDLKKAAKDPLFLADIMEINKDFSGVEYENL